MSDRRKKNKGHGLALNWPWNEKICYRRCDDKPPFGYVRDQIQYVRDQIQEVSNSVDGLVMLVHRLERKQRPWWRRLFDR